MGYIGVIFIAQMRRMYEYLPYVRMSRVLEVIGSMGYDSPTYKWGIPWGEITH